MGYYISGFGPMHQQLRAVAIWLPLQAAVLAVYPGFLLWVALRRLLGRLADLAFSLLFLAYNIAAHCTTVYTTVTFDLPPVPALFLSVEQLRWTMKSYSFIRENAYKVLYPWHKEDETGPAVWYAGQMEPQVGTFSTYLYFLFCPTVLYRDKYPRYASHHVDTCTASYSHSSHIAPVPSTPRVRPLRVLAHLTKVGASVMFACCVCVVMVCLCLCHVRLLCVCCDGLPLPLSCLPVVCVL